MRGWTAPRSLFTFCYMESQGDYIPPHVREYLEVRPGHGPPAPWNPAEQDTACQLIWASEEPDAEVYLGACESRTLAWQHGVTAMVVLLSKSEHDMYLPHFPASGQLAQAHVELEDSAAAGQQAEKHAALTTAARHIKTFVDEGHYVLVHCMAGVSRAPSAVIAFLILYTGLSYDAALAKVRAARPVVRPNPRFQEVLRALENNKR